MLQGSLLESTSLHVPIERDTRYIVEGEQLLGKTLDAHILLFGLVEGLARYGAQVLTSDDRGPSSEFRGASVSFRGALIRNLIILIQYRIIVLILLQERTLKDSSEFFAEDWIDLRVKSLFLLQFCRQLVFAELLHGQVNSIVAIEERLIVQLGFQIFDGSDPLNNVSLVETF